MWFRHRVPERLRSRVGIPGERALELSLYGGGDYELIYTIDPTKFPVEGVPSTVIGTVVKEPAVTMDGRPIAKRGYQHRWE